MRVLVCGGAGYVGSHTVRQLHRAGYEVVVLDNLIKGHIKAIGRTAFIHASINDKAAVARVFVEHQINAVMHFADSSRVGECVASPDIYCRNDVVGTLNLLEAMRKTKVNYFIFSSTAAVYGEPMEIPITENHATVPRNPYGSSKLAVESLLQWFSQAYGLMYTSLRYFNAAGADPAGDLGEDHEPETHLIARVLNTALGPGPGPEIKIFGTDHPTPDGTCIRDYVHVNDLADAHILALERLVSGGDAGIYNLGSGSGFSVRKVITTAEKVVGRPVKVVEDHRRPGDPAVLVASSAKAAKELGWKPKYDNLEQIIGTAWKWRQANPKGYAK